MACDWLHLVLYCSVSCLTGQVLVRTTTSMVPRLYGCARHFLCIHCSEHIKCAAVEHASKSSGHDGYICIQHVHLISEPLERVASRRGLKPTTCNKSITIYTNLQKCVMPCQVLLNKISNGILNQHSRQLSGNGKHLCFSFWISASMKGLRGICWPF